MYVHGQVKYLYVSWNYRTNNVGGSKAGFRAIILQELYTYFIDQVESVK